MTSSTAVYEPILEQALAHLKLQGWCVLAGVIPSDKVALIRQRVESAVHNHGTIDEVKRQGTRKGLIAYEQSFAPYLADPRILGVAHSLFGPQVRISFSSAHISYPGCVRGPLHADWPFNQNNAGHVPAPYPDSVMHMTTLWMLSKFAAETGATAIVPGSHRSANNPTGNNGVDPSQPYPGEIRAIGEAGSVLVFDSRLWHASTPNLSDEARVGMAVRYAPWWLNLDTLMPGSPERVRMVEETGKTENDVVPVPPDVYAALPENVKPLFRHWVRPCPK